MAKLLDEYDRVIFDSPPVGAVTDAQILGQQVDGAVLVVRANETSREMLKKAKLLLDNVNVRILGSLLNNLDVSRKGYGNYYYQYYSQQEDEPILNNPDRSCGEVLSSWIDWHTIVGMCA